MAYACENLPTQMNTGVVINGEFHPLMMAGRTPAPVRMPHCDTWTEVSVGDLQITQADMAEAFAWGLGVVTLFALAALPIRHFFSVIRNAFKVEDT